MATTRKSEENSTLSVKRIRMNKKTKEQKRLLIISTRNYSYLLRVGRIVQSV